MHVILVIEPVGQLLDDGTGIGSLGPARYNWGCEDHLAGLRITRASNESE
jgi:hypothetical protein